jgi:hypothetical protein
MAQTSASDRCDVESHGLQIRGPDDLSGEQTDFSSFCLSRVLSQLPTSKS